LIGLFTDALPMMKLGDLCKWCNVRGIEALEFGVGGYSASPHVDRTRLLADGDARLALGRELKRQDLVLAALNVAGNPLHPDSAIADDHDRALRDAIKLAALLDVPRVVAMSGCPGGPGPSSWPVFAGGAWL
jgi:sugar phosphate isomerase/epimerase